jgi:hypothetical protein
MSACANRRCGVPAVVNVWNGALRSPGVQAVPSLLNGSAVQLEESATRASISDSGPRGGIERMPPGVSVTNVPSALKCPTKPRFSAPCDAIHETYGVFPKNVMSGVAASSSPEIGLPPLNSSKWSPLTRRETKIAWWPPTSSDQTTHGAVVPPGVRLPAATRPC